MKNKSDILALKLNDFLTYRSGFDKLVKLTALIMVLVSAGLIRNFLEIEIGILPADKWYSYQPDTMLAMAAFPFYLCFFLYMSTHKLCKKLKIKEPQNRLIKFFLLIQSIHLLIPFLDWLGSQYGVTLKSSYLLNAQTLTGGFSLNPFSDMKAAWNLPIYFTPLIFFFTAGTSFGINIAWTLAIYLFSRILIKELRAPVLKTIWIILIMSALAYWPVYKYYFAFNWLFQKLSGIPGPNHFGLAAYFILAGCFGLRYFLKGAGTFSH